MENGVEISIKTWYNVYEAQVNYVVEGFMKGVTQGF